MSSRINKRTELKQRENPIIHTIFFSFLAFSVIIFFFVSLNVL